MAKVKVIFTAHHAEIRRWAVEENAFSDAQSNTAAEIRRRAIRINCSAWHSNST